MPSMFRTTLRLLASAALVFGVASPSFAQPSPAATVVPRAAAVTTVGTMRVERYGSGAPAMIFIPGLACGSWVWQPAVARYGAKHTIYLVTLAGFDGLPPPPTGSSAIDAADASLLSLITSEKLDRPIIVGHSLGGYLALRFGTEHPTLVSGIVSVDGTPILPPAMATPPEQRAAQASAIAATMRAATPAQFQAEQHQTIATMVTAPADVDRVAQLAARSDQGAAAEYFSELYVADLRPDLSKLSTPTLEIAPVPSTPLPYEGPQAAKAPMTDREAAYKAFYASLFTGAPNVQVEPIANSKHFVMIDQPEALYDAISAFIATLPR